MHNYVLVILESGKQTSEFISFFAKYSWAVTLVVNTTITFLINIVIHERRRSNDRHFQEMTQEYKISVLDSINAFIEFAKKSESVFIEITKNARLRSPTRRHIEKAIEDIDRENSVLDSYRIPFIREYSNELAKNIENCTEVYYDKVTKLIADLPNKKIKGQTVEGIKLDFENAHQRYIETLARLSAQYTPIRLSLLRKSKTDKRFKKKN